MFLGRSCPMSLVPKAAERDWICSNQNDIDDGFPIGFPRISRFPTFPRVARIEFFRLQ